MSDADAAMAAGAAAIRAGDTKAAAAAFARAVAADPTLADGWFNLGWALRAERRFDEALAAYARALDAGVAEPDAAHLNRAVILSEHLQDMAAARVELERAAALNPRRVETWLNLGNLHEDAGDAVAARDAYATALRLDPGGGRARARLAALEVHEGRPALAVTALKDALAGSPEPADRAEMLFALGEALDATGDYADAWQAYEAANWIARQIAPVRYDPAAHARLVDRLIRAFPAPLVPAARTAGPRPVFVVGMFRSGSTLAERLLGRHPAIAAAGELELIPALAARTLQPYPEVVPTLAPARLTALRDAYLAELARLRPGAAIVIDKRCDNVLHIGLLKALFPEALIVHTVRAPLDTLLSIHFLHFGDEVRYGHDLAEAAHYYIHYRRLMAHWRRLFPADIVDLDYDALVRDPEATLRPVLAALDLPWDPVCLRPEAAGGAVRTASAWQVRRPLHTRSSGRAVHYADAVAPVRALLAAAGLV